MTKEEPQFLFPFIVGPFVSSYKQHLFITNSWAMEYSFLLLLVLLVHLTTTTLLATRITQFTDSLETMEGEGTTDAR